MKKLDRLRKLKALAERGIEGERENAQKILDRLMKKYDIDHIDSAEENREIRYFRYSQKIEIELLGQIIYMVTGQQACYCKSPLTGRKIKELGVLCSEAEAVEIEAAYAFYKDALEDELEIFMRAFVSRNDLFPDTTEEIPQAPLDSTSMKVAAMMMAMDHHIFDGKRLLE
ncbi:MAG: DUF2786 domain-containing protein [Clostridia bacterium]|nr:DUF2786 domain-containing protein [Clostridia bacterium]